MLAGMEGATLGIWVAHGEGRAFFPEPAILDRVRDEVRPEPRDAEELHDLLLSLGVLRPRARWRGDFEALVEQGRAARVEPEVGELWLAAESAPIVALLHPGAPRGRRTSGDCRCLIPDIETHVHSGHSL